MDWSAVRWRERFCWAEVGVEADRGRRGYREAVWYERRCWAWAADCSWKVVRLRYYRVSRERTDIRSS